MSILQYFIQREQQELEAASNATDAIARRLHLEMADGYTSRIDEIGRQAERVCGTTPAVRMMVTAKPANSGPGKLEDGRS